MLRAYPTSAPAASISVALPPSGGRQQCFTPSDATTRWRPAQLLARTARWYVAPHCNSILRAAKLPSRAASVQLCPTTPTDANSSSWQPYWDVPTHTSYVRDWLGSRKPSHVAPMSCHEVRKPAGVLGRVLQSMDPTSGGTLTTSSDSSASVQRPIGLHPRTTTRLVLTLSTLLSLVSKLLWLSAPPSSVPSLEPSGATAACMRLAMAIERAVGVGSGRMNASSGKMPTSKRLADAALPPNPLQRAIIELRSGAATHRELEWGRMRVGLPSNLMAPEDGAEQMTST